MQILNVRVFTISYLICHSKDKLKNSKQVRRNRPSWADNLRFSQLLMLKAQLLLARGACQPRSFSLVRSENTCMLKWLTILTTIPSCWSASPATILRRSTSTNLKEWKIKIGSTSFNASALETAQTSSWTTSRPSSLVLSSRSSWDAFTATSWAITSRPSCWRAEDQRPGQAKQWRSFILTL